MSNQHQIRETSGEGGAKLRSTQNGVGAFECAYRDVQPTSTVTYGSNDSLRGTGFLEFGNPFESTADSKYPF